MDNYRVLVVDDVEKNLQLIGNHLSNKNLSLTLALDGQKALSAIQKKTPDLILLDISMPEMDGYEVCEILKKDESTRHIPIIFLTARNESTDIIKGFAYGAVDYITKPFNKDELVSRVLTHLELKKSRDIISEQKKHLEIVNARLQQHTKKVEELNEKLHQQNQQLKELNATKDKLFSIISHDLKNPLSNILTFTSMLFENIDNFDKNRIKRISKSLYEATENSTRLLENLLEWARSQDGQLRFEPTKIEITQFIDEQIKYQEKIAESKEIQLITQKNEELFVWADPDQLSTVLRNLLSNAIKFTPKNGQVKILTGYDSTKTKKSVKISIIDNGIGIDEKLLNQLFYVGSGTSRQGTDGERGTGLGLILCKEFVERNKGNIWAESEKNNGTSFFFTLPAIEK